MVGFVLILAALGCIGGGFYFMTQTNKTNKEKLTQAQSNLTKLLAEKTKNPVTASSGAVSNASNSLVRLEDLLKKAEAIYGASEKGRRQGLLWVDRQTKSFIITLGALNGLHPGSHLGIYDGAKKIDTAQVEIPLDVISYVKPVKTSLNHFENNYYRVMIEEDVPAVK